MRNVDHVGDVKRAVRSTRFLVQLLRVDVSGSGHDHDVGTLVALLVTDGSVTMRENERAVSYLPTRKQDVVGRADGVLGEVVDLDEVRRDEDELRLGTGQPYRLDDEVSRLQLRLEHHVFDLVRHAVRIQRQYVAVLRKKMQDIL